MPPQPEDENTSGEVKPDNARSQRDSSVEGATHPPSTDESAQRVQLEEVSKLHEVSERQDASVIAGETLEPIAATAGEFPGEQDDAARERETSSTGKYAFLVGAGILLSRIVGLIRQRVFAYYFGNSAAKDAFDAAFKIPNFLQNVFGEGALSASFIPVYVNLLSRKDEQEAGRVAGSIFALLALVTSILVLIGVLTTPYLISLIAYGFEGERRELTIRLVKIFFPGAGLLVLSAWCLGVLNSHRRFFLSYTAPVIWNLTIIAALVYFGGRVGEFPLAEYAAWASVLGSAFQFAVQLPTVLRLVKHLRPAFDTANTHVRTVARNFVPVFISRGVIQISAFIDQNIASLLPTGAVAALSYTQSLYTLPVSLFGMSVSAAELPAMSSAVGNVEEVAAHLRRRLDAGLRQIAFFIVPSAMAFLALGDVMAAALYQTGKFGRADALYVWGILAGSSVGLLASTLGRLYSSTYYALHDTRTPLRYALLRIVSSIILGILLAVYLPPLLGIDPRWGVAGLTVASGLAGWVEFFFLRRTLNTRIGQTGLSLAYSSKLWLAALLSAIIAWAIKLFLGEYHPILLAALILTPYGISYFAITTLFKLPEARNVVLRFTRFLPFRRG